MTTVDLMEFIACACREIRLMARSGVAVAALSVAVARTLSSRMAAGSFATSSGASMCDTMK